MRAEVERQVKAGELTPALAAQQILTPRPPNGKVNSLLFAAAQCKSKFAGVTVATRSGSERSRSRRCPWRRASRVGCGGLTLRCILRGFSKIFPARRYGGGALAVYLDGQPVVDVWTG